MQPKTFFFIAAATIAAGSLLYLISQKKRCVDKKKNDLNAFRIKFFNKIEAFRKDMLAYQLERLVWHNHLPVETIEKIRADYGKVLLNPSFYIYEELTNHHLLEDSLVLVEKEWLQKQGYPVPADNLKETIERHIFETEHIKALEILSTIMPDGKECIDYL